MDPLILSGILFAMVFFLMLAGLGVAVTIILVSVAGFYLLKGNPGLVIYVPYNTADSFVLTAIPLFIFMGEVLVQCGISEMLYRGVSKWLAWAPGGLLHANIGACGIFSAISGSSVATAATIGTIAIPALEERGYDRRLSFGSLAGGGTLGILIPPSITMIIYGMLASVSVGRLFAGGVIPGLLFIVFFMTYIGLRCLRNPSLAPKEEKFSLKTALLGSKDFWPMVLLIVVVLGGIFGGVVTPTEAAALGSFAALVMAVCFRPKQFWTILRKSLASSLETTCMVMFIVVSAYMFSALLSALRAPEQLVILVERSGLPGLAVLMLIYLLYLFLGCFIDVTSAIVMTSGAVLPLVSSFGYDLVWFGVVLVVLVEVGLLTPPMGLNLFVIQGISKRPLNEVVIGAWPFFTIEIFGIGLFTAFPMLILWLPTLFYG